jgi:hypothetical protein
MWLKGQSHTRNGGSAVSRWTAPCLSLFLVASAGAVEKPVLEYTSNQYGFRITLPGDWTCQTPPTGDCPLRAFAPVDRGPVTPNLFVRVGLNRHRTPTKRMLEGLAKLTAQRRAQMRQGKPPCKILKEETTQLATGQFVTRMEFTVNPDGEPLRALRVIAVGTYYSYLFTCFTRAADYDKDAPVFDRILSSVFVLPAPTVPPAEVSELLKKRTDGIGELHYARRVGLVKPFGWVRLSRRANWLKREKDEQRIVMELAPDEPEGQPKKTGARPYCVLTADDTLERMTAANQQAYLAEWVKLLKETYDIPDPAKGPNGKPRPASSRIYRAEVLDMAGRDAVGVRATLTYKDEHIGLTRAVHVIVFKHFTRYSLLTVCPENQVSGHAEALQTVSGFLRTW